MIYWGLLKFTIKFNTIAINCVQWNMLKYRWIHQYKLGIQLFAIQYFYYSEFEYTKNIL